MIHVWYNEWARIWTEDIAGKPKSSPQRPH